MSAELVLVAVLVTFFVLIVFEVPIAWALAGTGGLGVILLRGFGPATSALASLPYQSTSSFLLTIVPMFILMGMLSKHALIAEDVYAIANRRLTRVPGGLGLATIAACGAFGAVSGSSVADVATIGRFSITEMMRYGYHPRLATGIVGSAGTLAVLIPPSIILVIYGALTGESVGALLLAGLVPGLFSGLIYAVFVAVRVWRRPALVRYQNSRSVHESSTSAALALDVDSHSESERPATAQQQDRTGAAGLLKMLLLFVLVIGGIYSGTFTATESAAAGAFAAFLMLIATFRRSVRALRDAVIEALRETASITSMVFAIYFGAVMFSFFFVSAGVPSSLARGLISLPWDPWMVVMVILIATIPLGMFLDGLSIMLIVIPLVYPVVTGLGYDGMWFGILIVKMIELSLITPPVGINAYMVAGVSEGVEVEEVFRGLMPFAAMDALTIVLIFIFPGIVTWLPSLMST